MKRWLLWTFRCQRGRRCAHLEVTQSSDDIPAGAMGVMEWTCASCGTSYQSTVLFGNDGSFTQTPKTRVSSGDSDVAPAQARNR